MLHLPNLKMQEGKYLNLQN